MQIKQNDHKLSIETMNQLSSSIKIAVAIGTSFAACTDDDGV
jgi:hypothetical protein